METTPQVAERHVTRKEALEIADRCAELLEREFGATRVIVFGSARGDAPWHEGSDLDLAVEGIAPAEFFNAWGALDREIDVPLEIDLVELETAHPELRARILGEVETSDDPIENLRRLVEDELKALADITEHLAQVHRDANKPPSWTEMAGMSKLVHDFYTGTEKIFERIAVQFDGGVPKGEHWHAALLNLMNKATEGIRPAVVDDELWSWLEDYRDFRHFFRNAYRKDLEWYRLMPHVDRMPRIYESLRRQLDQFFETIESARSTNDQ